jgi:glycosyltransferase involved in cell wall biosynthesis
MSQPELSIVIPFLNEEQVLPLLRERLENIRNRPAAWELLFVSDGSTDGSTKFIEACAHAASFVKLVVLTRNFGHQSAIYAGLSFASVFNKPDSAVTTFQSVVRCSGSQNYRLFIFRMN